MLDALLRGDPVLEEDYPRHPRKSTVDKFGASLRRHNLALFMLSVVALMLSYSALEFAYEPPWHNSTDVATCNGGGSYDQSIVVPVSVINAAITLVSWVLLFSYYSIKFEAYCSVSLMPRDPLAYVASDR